MDIASLVGLVVGFVCMIVSIILSSEISSYIDLPSIFVVFGGTIAASCISTPLPKVKKGFASAKYALTHKELSPGSLIPIIKDLAQKARKEGLLALEETTRDMEDEFLKKGIMLVVDGTDPELARDILETELSFIQNRHEENQTFWGTIAEMAPAWGMIGTLIGLIGMLGSIDDPSSIGPNMAVALITTLYGSIIANYIATPISNKLKIKSAEETLVKQVMIEGILSIQAGENPRVIEEKLKAFLPPEIRGSSDDSDMN